MLFFPLSPLFRYLNSGRAADGEGPLSVRHEYITHSDAVKKQFSPRFFTPRFLFHSRPSFPLYFSPPPSAPRSLLILNAHFYIMHKNRARETLLHAALLFYFLGIILLIGALGGKRMGKVLLFLQTQTTVCMCM